MKDQEFLVLLDHRIEKIARAILQEATGGGAPTSELVDNASLKLREHLALINAKEHVSVREAALLLSCSQSHIRKLVTMARKGKARRPIPYVDIEGVIVFRREILLDWAAPTSHLQVVKNEAA